ncbi:MAG: sugar ABC transporter permease, partial [Kiloniellales bacterium]|nr:sugar ABC transporter permease [Kiloniellales bacterium]
MKPRHPAPTRPREGIFTGEQGFALLLVGPGLATLILTTTFPLAYLIWSSFQNINLAMPFLDGFVGLENYRNILGDSRFWHAMQLTGIYTFSTVVLQLVIGLGLALLVMQIPAGQWVFRIVAILPIVLAPVVVGLFWRTLMLAPEFGILDFIVRALG